MKTNWLDRRVAAPGPHLALCLSEAEFHAACQYLNCRPPRFILNDHSHATTHFFESDGKDCVVVCLRDFEGRDPIEVAGLLIHEAVHVWQSYANGIGEHSPGDEQEAYAIQAIAQELLAEFARRQARG